MEITIREPDEELKKAEKDRYEEIGSHRVDAGVDLPKDFNPETDRPPFMKPMREHLNSLKGDYYWYIYANQKLVGEIVLWEQRSRTTYDVCFCVDPDYWNRGIATEALKQVVDYAFNVMRIHKLLGDNDSVNPASGRVLEKAGFHKEAVSKEHVFHPVKMKYIDVVHWVKFNDTENDIITEISKFVTTAKSEDKP